MDNEKIPRLLCQLLQDPIPVDGLIEPINHLTRSEWKALLNLAGLHKLTCMLHQRLRILAEQVTVPEDITAHLHQSYLRAHARNLRILNQVNQILPVFREKGVDVIGLKGIYLLENIYPDIGLRYLADVDLLVKSEDIPAAITILQDLGFQAESFFDPADENKDLHHAPTMRNASGLAIDLHWTLAREVFPFAIDINGLWQRSVPAKVAGVEILALSTEDLILYLCTHFCYHHILKSGLRELYDIREILQKRQAEIDWPTLVKFAREYKVERVIALSFNLLERLFEFQVENQHYSELIASFSQADILDKALEQLFFEQVSTPRIKSVDVARFSSLQGVSSKLSLMLDRIFLPKAKLGRRYNLSPHSPKIYLYYPVRFFQLTWQYAGFLLKQLFVREKDQQIDQTLTDLLDFVDHENEIKLLRDWMTQA